MIADPGGGKELSVDPTNADRIQLAPFYEMHGFFSIGDGGRWQQTQSRQGFSAIAEAAYRQLANDVWMPEHSPVVKQYLADLEYWL